MCLSQQQRDWLGTPAASKRSKVSMCEWVLDYREWIIFLAWDPLMFYSNREFYMFLPITLHKFDLSKNFKLQLVQDIIIFHLVDAIVGTIFLLAAIKGCLIVQENNNKKHD